MLKEIAATSLLAQNSCVFTLKVWLQQEVRDFLIAKRLALLHSHISRAQCFGEAVSGLE